MKGGVLMNSLIVGIFAVLIILIVYISTLKSDVYMNEININICKLLSIKISNKVKRPGSTEKHPERTKH